MGPISMVRHELNLNGFSYQELFLPAGLSRLDAQFLSYLENVDQSLYAELLIYRSGELTDPKLVSNLIIDCAPVLEAFIAELFDISEQVGESQTRVQAEDPIFAFKKHFVLREARRALKESPGFAAFDELNQWLQDQLQATNIKVADPELAVAIYAKHLLADPLATKIQQQKLIQWCVQAIETDAGQHHVAGWVSFHFPKRLNYANLVNVEAVGDEEMRLQAPEDRWRQRDGFGLTDERMGLREVLDEVHYCVYCHKNDGDFCSKGFPVKKNAKEMGLKTNPLNEILTGCPLEEKISEMNLVKKQGFGIAALAIVMIDNPMCPATGHRICNDCMKACIYQKQEPVNIPQIETHVLTDVLSLPWGVEIYDLLTRWNPLRFEQIGAKEYNGKKILVMGMGPAGFTLAHHLLMEGFAVVGADGLKIENLPMKYLTEPIYDYDDIKENLDDRIMAGFGGVAEYGITVRWDKNFLKLIYLSLMRRPHFQVYGSVRFGGTLTTDDVWTLGFDHLAIAVGAGLPRELKIPHSLAPGMRQANDFLMALQLTGAAKESSLANLDVRLPAVVIGGGLTGVDTATEVQAYYIKQVEKIAHRYKTLSEYEGIEKLRARFDSQSLATLDEFLLHAKAVAIERSQAKVENRAPHFIQLIRKWGGVTIAYRRTMQESPAYKRNYEEVEKAFEEGIYYAEGLEPEAVIIDSIGSVKGLKCRVRILDEEGKWMKSDSHQILDANSIFVATGAKPNIAYEYEHRGTFLREGDNYQRFENVNGKLELVAENNHCKEPPFGAFTSYERDHHRVTFLGDTHSVFHGSVVKAIASAKQIYPAIVKTVMAERTQGSVDEYRHFQQQIMGLFQASVYSVTRLSDELVELVVRAPMAARNFKPGNFYRIQNYEATAEKVDATLLQTEAMAMLGMRNPEQSDLLSFLVLERGASSRLVATFKPLDLIAVMGPTGVRTTIPDQPETVMIIGGTMAIAQLRSLGPALRNAGHRVIFVACMEDQKDFYNREELEAATDTILWVTANGNAISTTRPQDRTATGELVLALRDYALGQLDNNAEPPPIPLNEVNRVIVVGSSVLVSRIQQARTGLLSEFFNDRVKCFASVYGAMQCMLKGVCAQCLQWQIDPVTGERVKAVYACSWQEQPLEVIDVGNIDERLRQNRTSEILTNCWLDYLFEKYTIIKV